MPISPGSAEVASAPIAFANCLTMAFKALVIVPTIAPIVIRATINGELTQQDGGKTQDGRTTKKCGVRLSIPGLARHFYTSFCRSECYSRPVA